MNLNNSSERMRKEMVVVFRKVGLLSEHLLEGTKENYETPQSGHWSSGQKSNPIILEC